jgi:signal transduction histidine kinase
LREHVGVVLRIMDQGRGFDAGVATHSGSGLIGMQERVMSLGGNLSYHASGTSLGLNGLQAGQ